MKWRGGSPTALRTGDLSPIPLELDLASVSAASEEVVRVAAPAGPALEGCLGGHLLLLRGGLDGIRRR
jgi:hypothetical protein